MKAKGLGIVFVSHWLEEVFRIADRITVLRDSKFIGTKPAAELDHAKVIKMMVGRDVAEVTTHGREPGNVVLEVKHLTRVGILQDISFHIRAGEIVTLAGLVGAGRSEVTNCIFGIDPYEEGEIRVNGKIVPPNDPKGAINTGIGLLPEDRRRQALVAQLSVGTNTTLAMLDHIAPRWMILKERENQIIREAQRSLAIKMASPAVRVSTLSGGNQQKVVLGRWLARKPSLLILDEPTTSLSSREIDRLFEIVAI